MASNEKYQNQKIYDKTYKSYAIRLFSRNTYLHLTSCKSETNMLSRLVKFSSYYLQYHVTDTSISK